MHLNLSNFRTQVTKMDLSLEETSHSARVHSLNEVMPIFEKLDLWMKGYGYPHKDRFAVCLALREAATNAIQHGHGSEASKTVRISFAVRSDVVAVEVEDQGPGFDPNQSRPVLEDQREQGRGWGLYLIRANVTWVRFNSKGNCVTFGLKRSEN